jgi:hypothetical protein
LLNQKNPCEKSYCCFLERQLLKTNFQGKVTIVKLKIIPWFVFSTVFWGISLIAHFLSVFAKKGNLNKMDTLKEMICTLGMNPEQLLTRDALAEGAITHKNQEDIENHQLKILSPQLKI